jgi:hypothetical protein
VETPRVAGGPDYYDSCDEDQHEFVVNLRTGWAGCEICGETWAATEDQLEIAYIKDWWRRKRLRQQIRRERFAAFCGWVRRGFKPEPEPTVPF